MLFVTIVLLVSNPKYILGFFILITLPSFEKPFCKFTKSPVLFVSEADVTTTPYPCVYSYVALVYEFSFDTTSLGVTYTNVFLLLIVYSQGLVEVYL